MQLYCVELLGGGFSVRTGSVYGKEIASFLSVESAAKFMLAYHNAERY